MERGVTMRSLIRFGVMVLVAVLALGACGGSDSKDSSGTGSNPNPSTQSDNESDGGGDAPASDAACKLITADEATTLFGGTEAKSTEDASPVSNAASTCIWGGEDTENHSYLLQMRFYGDEAHYGGDLYDDEAAVDGLGDKAFVRKADGIAGVDVQWVADGNTYAVNYGITNVMADVKKNASDQADELVTLLKANQGRV
jgi:hypothetical protein